MGTSLLNPAVPHPPTDQVDILAGNPAVAPAGMMRLALQYGLPGAAPVPSISVDGGAYGPIGGGPIVTLPGVLTFPGIASIPGLKAWRRLDAGVTFGTWPAVATIADQSGLGGRDLAGVGGPQLMTGAAGINGRPALSCVPGTPSYARNTGTSPVLADRGARTVFVVAQARSAAGGALVTFRTGAANIFSFEHLVQGATLFNYASGGAAVGHGIFPGVNITNVPHIYEFSYDGQFATAGAVNSTIRVKIDGIAQPILDGGGFSVTETGTAGDCLGTREDAPSLGWDGLIGEEIIFDRSLTPFERLLVGRYLAARFPPLSYTAKINTCWLGDSHGFGTGNAASIAAGGPRQELFGLHSNLFMGVGEFYTPLGTSSTPANDGNWNACEGNVGFQSGSGGTGIGGANLVRFVAANPADLYLLCIGTNDGPDLGGITAAQTGANIRAICDYIYAQLPASQVIVIRSPLGDSTHAANNAVVLQQGPATEAALIGAPNVLRNPALVTAPLTGGAVILPIALPNSAYVDGIHLDPVLGWHVLIAPGGTTTGLGLDAELRVRGR